MGNNNNFHNSSWSNGATAELTANDYQIKVLEVVHDEEGFRKLQEDMRKNHRSGFASRQVLYQLVTEQQQQEEEEEQKSTRNNNNKLLFNNNDTSKSSSNLCSSILREEVMSSSSSSSSDHDDGMIKKGNTTNNDSSSSSFMLDRKQIMANLKKGSQSLPKDDLVSSFVRSTMTSLRIPSRLPATKKRIQTSPCA